MPGGDDDDIPDDDLEEAVNESKAFENSFGKLNITVQS